MLDVCMVSKSEINSYLPAIKHIISTFSYPLTDQKGAIDYGNDYAAFFSTFGEPHFFLLFDNKDDNNKLIGTCVATKKVISISGIQHEALYFSNLRIDKQYQLTKAASFFYRRIMQHIARHEALSQIKFSYFITMTPIRSPQIESKAKQLMTYSTKQPTGDTRPADFMRVKSGTSTLNLFGKTAECLIYLVPPVMLTNIATKSPLEETNTHHTLLNLSPNVFQDTAPETRSNPLFHTLTNTVKAQPTKNIVDLTSLKDFIQNDKRLLVAHLANTPLTGTAYLTHLQNSAKQASQHIDSYDYISFALDIRRQKMIDYLTQLGILSETRATIYCYNRTKESIDHKMTLIGTYQI